jgi:cyclophilin family peptidyl-prolyl cis-trans isomerase
MAHTTPPGSNPKVAFETRYGRFVAQLFEREAPISTANLLTRVEKGLLANSSIYRIVTLANQPDTVPAKIEVVQFGLPRSSAQEAAPLPPIAHETTAATGLRHLDGTLSMARLAPGTAETSLTWILAGAAIRMDKASLPSVRLWKGWMSFARYLLRRRMRPISCPTRSRSTPSDEYEGRVFRSALTLIRNCVEVELTKSGWHEFQAILFSSESKSFLRVVTIADAGLPQRRLLIWP